MSLLPLEDRIVVRRALADQVSPGGIVLPGQALTRADRGVVIAVGPGKLNKNGARVPVDVKVGEAVVLGPFAGQSLTVDGEDVVVCREEEIFAVVDP